MKLRGPLAMLIAAIILTGCGSKRLSTYWKLLRFERQEIVIPKDLSMVINGRILPPEMPEGNRPLFVAWYSADACTTCALSKLYAYQEIADLATKEKGFDWMIIFSPSDDQLDDLQMRLERDVHPFPVYVDFNNTFKLYNPNIPDAYHSFLLGRDGKPILVGNPLSGRKMMYLFKKTLAERLNDKN